MPTPTTPTPPSTARSAGASLAASASGSAGAPPWGKAILRVTEALAGASTSADVARVLVEDGREALGAAAAVVGLRTPDGRHFQVRGVSGFRRGILEDQPIPVEKNSPLAQAARTGQAVLLPDRSALDGMDGPLPALAAAHPEHGAWAALPLVDGGAPFGAIGLAYQGPRHFDPEQQDLLRTVARVCSVALERALLFDAEQAARGLAEARSRRQAALAKLGQEALLNGDLQAFLDHCVRVLAAELDVELCKVLRLLPEGGALVLEAGVGWREGLVGRGNVGSDIDSQAGYTLLAEEPVVVADLRTEVRFRGPPLLHDHGVVSGMSVVIGSREDPWGVLGVHTRRQRDFTPDEVHFLQAAANILAAALGAKAREEQLLAANARLEEADRLRSELFNSVSHDLRTPLTPMLMQLELLRRTGPTERQRASLDVLERSARRLAGLVDDLLDVGRLESGRLRIEPRNVDLRPLLEESLALFRPLAEQRGVALEAVLDGPLPAHADPPRVVQVVGNLLSNALKATDAGGKVTLAARAEGAVAVVRVHDTGRGISAAELPTLFRPFTQLREGHVGERGTGLGLYISHGIAEQHGGHLWADSPGPGLGATFTLTLPATVPDGHARHRRGHHQR